ncbi:MAG: PQQ-binding-like beta-propeller repeat protein [Rhodothalassiaceae bacterium]
MRALCALAMAAAVAACAGNDENRPALRGLPEQSGERVSVLTVDTDLEPDESLEDVTILLPRPYVNTAWPQPGGVPSHALYHLDLPPKLDQVWAADMGRGNDRFSRLIGEPVSDGKRLYAIDTRATITAVQEQSGASVWRTQIERPGERQAIGFGGGVAYRDGRLYATTGLGILAALDADSGEILWQFDATVPFRGGPSVAENRVIAVTQDNQIFAVDAQTGEVVWDQFGLAEPAGTLGASSPAIVGDTVIVALSSGELIAFRIENGTPVWQDTLSRTRRLTPLATLNDIDGHPVVDRGRVFALSHSGRMVSIDLRSGERVWEKNIGGVGKPWIGGDFIYLMTVDNQLVAITRSDGRVRWIRQLQRFKNQEKRRGVIRWAGPVLAGDRLVVASSDGYLVTVSPYTGEFLSGQAFDAGTIVPPIVVDKTLYILNNEARLLAYR